MNTPLPEIALRERRFMTREERFTRRFNSPAPYFRLHDSLCRSYLELAVSPREFEGLKLLFPFVRESSVLQAGRGCDNLAVWMHLAFLAGHDFGRAHSESLEDLLPGQELRDAAVRVGLI